MTPHIIIPDDFPRVIRFPRSIERSAWEIDRGSRWFNSVARYWAFAVFDLSQMTPEAIITGLLMAVENVKAFLTGKGTHPARLVVKGRR